MLLATSVALTACQTTAPASSTAGAAGEPIPVAASINAWGSVLSQLGGDRVQQTSIITNPATDPHDYEPTPSDGRTIAISRLFVENGIGYDSWAAKSLAADPDPVRQVVNVGTVTGIAAGGNPHRWYSPADVEKVADAITAALTKLDPAHAAYFRQRRTDFDTVALAPYHQLIDTIRSRYAGTPIGASESIVSPLADALGLTMRTPASFLKAISDGTDPSAADKRLIDAQISRREIKVYVFNSQNSTPDVSAQVSAARRQGIPIVAVTETLSPAGATFQQWQVAQLHALQAALHQATGR
ncbi:MAG TPA: zinc ABC transporter substrate-binding protein [Jatrophihabitantaceae bacterium]|jgi:zinc/manganese transport system substrate-binding protein